MADYPVLDGGGNTILTDKRPALVFSSTTQVASTSNLPLWIDTGAGYVLSFADFTAVLVDDTGEAAVAMPDAAGEALLVQGFNTVRVQYSGAE